MRLIDEVIVVLFARLLVLLQNTLLYGLHLINIRRCVILSRYYTTSLIGLMVKFGPSVFYLFSPSVINSVFRFSIYSVLQIRSTIPTRKIPNPLSNTKETRQTTWNRLLTFNYIPEFNNYRHPLKAPPANPRT